MRPLVVLCLLLASLALANAVGRVVFRRGQRVTMRSGSGKNCNVASFDTKLGGGGNCLDPHGPGACSPGVLLASPDCSANQQCCYFVNCQSDEVEDSGIHAFGGCTTANACASLPNRKVAPSSTCTSNNLVCCVDTKHEGTVGDAIDADKKAVSDASNTPCNDNTGTCDVDCAAGGTLEPDTGGSCNGGQCCVNSTPAVDPNHSDAPTEGSSHTDDSDANSDANAHGGDADAHTDANTDANADANTDANTFANSI